LNGFLFSDNTEKIWFLVKLDICFLESLRKPAYSKKKQTNKKREVFIIYCSFFLKEDLPIFLADHPL